MEKIELKYKFEKFEINSQTINQFYLVDNRRRLRVGQMCKIKKMIQNRDNFDSPIIVNEILGVKRVVDGQHRITAIREILKFLHDFKIDILLVTYTSLNIDQERDIFKKWNSGTRQSSEDFIQMWVEDIPMYKKMQNFPVKVSIYQEEGCIKFRQLVCSYIQSKNKSLKIWPTAVDFIEKAKKLENEDYDFLLDFIKEFVEYAGPIKKDNPFLMTTPFSVIMFLYMNGRIKTKFWDIFVKKVKGNKEIINLSRAGGLVAVDIVKEKMAKRMGINNIEDVKPIPTTIWTDEKISWLRKNWPKSQWNIDDITEEFNSEFNTDVKPGTVRYYLNQNKILKDEKYFKREGSPRVWTKKVIDFMKKCSEDGLSSYEAHQKLVIEFEMPISIFAFRHQAGKSKITFKKLSAEDRIKLTDEQKEFIIKNKYRSPYEIESMSIERFGSRIKPEVIRRFLGIKKEKTKINIKPKYQEVPEIKDIDDISELEMEDLDD